MATRRCNERSEGRNIQKAAITSEMRVRFNAYFSLEGSYGGTQRAKLAATIGAVNRTKIMAKRRCANAAYIANNSRVISSIVYENRKITCARNSPMTKIRM